MNQESIYDKHFLAQQHFEKLSVKPFASPFEKDFGRRLGRRIESLGTRAQPPQARTAVAAPPDYE